MLLVWMSTLRGPTPQKWHQDSESPGTPISDLSILAYYPVPKEQENLSLNELAEAYPYGR